MLPMDETNRSKSRARIREMEKYKVVTIFRKVHLAEDYNSVFCTEVCTYINKDYMYFVIMGCDYVMHFVPYKDISGIR